MKRRCAGFPPYPRCEREAGTPWSPYWCERCDKLRRELITASLERIVAEMDERAAEEAGE